MIIILRFSKHDFKTMLLETEGSHLKNPKHGYPKT